MPASTKPSTNSPPLQSKRSVGKSRRTTSTSTSKTKTRVTDTLFVACEKVAADLRRSFAIIKPPKRLRISEWAKHARLKDGSRYYPWPFQVEWLDEMNNPRTSKMTVMKSTRVGYTQAILAGLGYFTAHDPRNVLMVRPTIKDAQKFFKEHVALVLSWPIMNSLNLGKSVFGTLRDTITEKYFPGGFIKGVGSESPNGLRDLDVDVLIMDEVDGFALTAGVDGDPSKLAEERLLQSYDPRNIAGSTPTDEAVSKINRRFLESDQRHYNVPCPTCKHMQVLKWGSGDENEPGIKWSPKKAPTEFWYQCEKGCRISEAKKLWMLENGKWIAKFPEIYERTGHAGFHINALYSLQPNAKWPNLVEKFLESYKSPVTFKTFVNTTLGEVWKSRGEAPDWERLYNRSRINLRKRGVVPYGSCFLTAAVDIQRGSAGGGADGRLEVFIWGWGRGGSSWLVDHIVIKGDPFGKEVWDKLTEVAYSKWQHENGTFLGLERIGVDHGYATAPAYRWCKKVNRNFALPIKGAKDLTAPIIAPSKPLDIANTRSGKSEQIHVHNVGGNTLKVELYALLSLDPGLNGDPNPYGYVDIPAWVDDEFCKQLVAEEWIPDRNEWRKNRANEALDGWCYARAMASERGSDKWSEAAWAEYETPYLRPGDEPPPAHEVPVETPEPDHEQPHAGSITPRHDTREAEPAEDYYWSDRDDYLGTSGRGYLDRY
ncbi:phage terminase large subunit family protein [Rhizobium leguminosarum]|uniref:phage terminase large subunit family protein n=1 Tax=Rhizobium leguminosarum TaxID=384 RepID=UPI001A0C925F|nr:terminase gpA endonuclease subunit [Rhizobium leguminosarum]NKJ77749.1 hypothetical protein [Rhizobium leguminosarum bv. viciae]